MFKDFIQKRGDEFPFNITLVDVEIDDQPLLYVNQSFCELTGYSDQEILGKNCRFLQRGKANPHTLRIIRDAIQKRAPVCADLLNFRKSGEKFYNRLVLIPIKESREGYLGLQHEIPENKFEKLNPPETTLILDRVLNPLTVLLLSDLISEDEYKKQFAEATKKLRDFIVNLPEN